MFTAIIFVPAALLTKVFGEPFANFTVLLQDSFILAWLAAVLLPTYLIPVILVVLITLLSHKLSGLLTLAGINLALVPQLITNLARAGEWGLLRLGSNGLVALQSSYALYIVRYDTILRSESARVLLPPDMARLVSHLPFDEEADRVKGSLERYGKYLCRSSRHRSHIGEFCGRSTFRSIAGSNGGG